MILQLFTISEKMNSQSFNESLTKRGLKNLLQIHELTSKKGLINYLVNFLLGMIEKGRKVGKSVAVEDELRLLVRAGDDVADGAECDSQGTVMTR